MLCRLIIAAATKYALPPILLVSIVHQESTLNPSAINAKAAVPSYGLGQLTKSTARRICTLHEKDLLDMEKNLDCTAKVLSYQFYRYGGDYSKAISAYNAGAYSQKNIRYVDLVKKKMIVNYCGV